MGGLVPNLEGLFRDRVEDCAGKLKSELERRKWWVLTANAVSQQVLPYQLRGKRSQPAAQEFAKHKEKLSGEVLCAVLSSDSVWTTQTGSGEAFQEL